MPNPPADGGERDTPGPLGLSQLIATGVIDVVPGDPPVPITVWRVADPDDTDGSAADGFTTRTAQLLVGLYTRAGDTIVSVGDGPALHGAAGAGGCRYLTVPDPADLAGLAHVAGAARLLVLRWPPPDGTCPASLDADPQPASTAMVEVFTTCRRLMTPDGYTIVAVAPAPDTYGVDHAWRLVPAARAGGLGWLEHIVAITTPIDGDHLAVPAAPAGPATIGTVSDLRVHIDLYVFVIRAGRHG